MFSLITTSWGVTRLLDFTESFYIASFFAVENASTDSCVWAVNKTKLKENGLDKLGIKLDDSPTSTHKYDTYSQHTEIFIQNPEKKSDIG